MQIKSQSVLSKFMRPYSNAINYSYVYLCVQFFYSYILQIHNYFVVSVCTCICSEYIFGETTVLKALYYLPCSSNEHGIKSGIENFLPAGFYSIISLCIFCWKEKMISQMRFYKKSYISLPLNYSRFPSFSDKHCF